LEPIRMSLQDCEKMPLVKFSPITTDLPLFDVQNLSNDQAYLYKMTSAISGVNIRQSLLNLNLGNIGHSRWFTTANRILRLHISTDNLKHLVNYVMKVYIPAWFRIKLYSLVSNGSRHFLHILIYFK